MEHSMIEQHNDKLKFYDTQNDNKASLSKW